MNSTESIRDLVSNTRNVIEDIASMYEVITDIFPGIEKCVNKNLVVRTNCTFKGFLFLHFQIIYYIIIRKYLYDCFMLVYDETIVPAIYENIKMRIETTSNDKKKISELMLLIKQKRIVENFNFWPK